MTREELVQTRIKFLKDMDRYVKNVIGDDEITVYVWFACGLPDGYDETDLLEIASDDDLWTDCVECFARCCKISKER